MQTAEKSLSISMSHINDCKSHSFWKEIEEQIAQYSNRGATSICLRAPLGSNELTESMQKELKELGYDCDYEHGRDFMKISWAKKSEAF